MEFPAWLVVHLFCAWALSNMVLASNIAVHNSSCTGQHRAPSRTKVNCIFLHAIRKSPVQSESYLKMLRILGITASHKHDLIWACDVADDRFRLKRRRCSLGRAGRKDMVLFPSGHRHSFPTVDAVHRFGRIVNSRPATRVPDKRLGLFVYGKDDRSRIPTYLLRKFPFSNIVRLSTGCTGTLVTPFHVLTAAHCVHNGKEFRHRLEMLKVEIPDRMGVRIYYVEKIGIPSRWLLPRSPQEHPASFDYAVIHLSYAVHARFRFTPLAVPTTAVLTHQLQFLAFPSNGDGLWRSVCPAGDNRAMDAHVILTRCDAAVGNSGAAILSDDPREGKRVVGLLSSVSTLPLRRPPFYTHLSVITAFTWAKLYDICAELGRPGAQHGVCPPLNSIPRSRRVMLEHNPVIPFFG